MYCLAGNMAAQFMNSVHDLKKSYSFLMTPTDQAFDTTSVQSQRGRDHAGAQPTAQEQLQRTAQRGETLDENFHLFTALLLRARISTFTRQGRGPLRWDIESRQTTVTLRLRSEGIWCSSSCCFQYSPHKFPVPELAGSSQTGND